MKEHCIYRKGDGLLAWLTRGRLRWGKWWRKGIQWTPAGLEYAKKVGWKEL